MRIYYISFLLVSSFIVSCKMVHLGGNSYKRNDIQFDHTNKDTSIVILYSHAGDTYLDSLKKLFPLDHLFLNTDSELDRVKKILTWTHSQWEHDGHNEPKKSDAITILNEVKEGKRFPCFAFAIVLRDQLNANGFTARTVYLKTKNCETSRVPPGHVVTEVFLNSLHKWVFLDGQDGVLPLLNNKPLNAVEFQAEITKENTNLELYGLNDSSKIAEYYSWIYPYLFYLDTYLDNRYDNGNKAYTIQGKRSLMLVPIGAKKVQKIKFWNMYVDYCLYTNSLLDFYAAPVLK